MLKTNKESLRIAIIGAGGIGCYYGARLQQAGHQVYYIARGEHLATLQSKGLNLEHPDFFYQGKVEAYSLEALCKQFQPEGFDALLICTKATATQNIATQLKDWFEKTQQQTLVISLQNGIDNESQLASALGDDCIIGGLAVRIGGHIVEAGKVEATGIAQVIWGAWPHKDSPADKRFSGQLTLLTDVFKSADIPTRKVPDIRRELWRKLVINNGVNPLSVVTRLDTHAMSHHPHFGNIVHQLMQEAARVAIADGETLTEQDADEMYQLIRHFDPIKTSMLVDFEKGRQLEVDEISGAVIQRSKQLGISVPYTEMVYALLHHMIQNS
jgi:2-dehydropantoate 2-reductase